MKRKPELDALDEKLSKFFPGRIVRKDLVKNLKVGFTIPVFVLEYLLGKYCSTTDEDEIQSGLIHVKTAISERIVRGDESELVKAARARSPITRKAVKVFYDKVTESKSSKVEALFNDWKRLFSQVCEDVFSPKCKC